MASILKDGRKWLWALFSLASCSFAPTSTFETPQITLDHTWANLQVHQKYLELKKQKKVAPEVILLRILPPGIQAETYTLTVAPRYHHKFLGVFDISFREIDEDFVQEAQWVAQAAGGDFVFFPPDDDPKAIIVALGSVGGRKRMRGWIFKLDPQVKKQLLKKLPPKSATPHDQTAQLLKK
ncbi:MAG: hypothetical protein J6Y94_08970 [Bacteriovoracaceae bacterium]|nr:hypothetical protein [Bacteriovoracaceae bacterium]